MTESLRKRIITEKWFRVDTPDGGFIDPLELVSEYGYPFIPQKLSPAPFVSNRASVTIYRNMVKVKVPTKQPPHLIGIRRGAVDIDFSGKKLKRMLDAFNQWRIPRAGLFFVHLTYPSEYPLDWRIWKNDLKLFKQRLQRHFPGVQGIWKLELQRRGAPHYHMVLSLGKDKSIKRVRKFIDAAWAEIAHKNDQYQGKYACRVEPVFSIRHAMNYAAKYCAKPNYAPIDDDGVIMTMADLHETIGRQWGKIGKLDCSPYENTTISLQEITYTRVAIAQEIKARGARGWKPLIRPKTHGSFSIYGIGAESDDRFPMAQSVLMEIRKRYYESGGWDTIWDIDQRLWGGDNGSVKA